MTSTRRTQNNNVWETSLEKRLQRLQPQEGESNPLQCQRREAEPAGAQQDSCPRHSAAVIVRNKWWPRDDFHAASWNSSRSSPDTTRARGGGAFVGGWRVGLPVRNIQALKHYQSFREKRAEHPWSIFILYQYISPKMKKHLVTSQGVICILTHCGGANTSKTKTNRRLPDRTEIQSKYRERKSFVNNKPFKIQLALFLFRSLSKTLLTEREKDIKDYVYTNTGFPNNVYPLFKRP